MRVVRRVGDGSIEVFFDDMDEPLMTATDTTYAGGRFGFGSFDNYGRAKHVKVVGTPQEN